MGGGGGGVGGGGGGGGGGCTAWCMTYTDVALPLVQPAQGRMTNGGDRQDQAVRALVNNATVPLPRAGSVDSTQTGVRTMPVVPTPVAPPRRGESSRRVKRGGRRARGGGGSSRKKRPSSTGRVRKGKGKGKGSG